jgi:hypothetical protein
VTCSTWRFSRALLDNAGSAEVVRELLPGTGRSRTARRRPRWKPSQTRRALGDAWQRAGRTTDARRAYRQALELLSETDNPRAARLKADLNHLLQPHRSRVRDLTTDSWSQCGA